MAAKRKHKETAAERARAKRFAAVMTPPGPVAAPDVSLEDLELVVVGVRYPIGRNIEGDTPWGMGLDETATISLPIRSPDRSLEAALVDDELRLAGAITLTLDTIIYVLQTAETDETGLYTLAFEDQVSWRLKQFTTLMHADRKTTTRASFILRMVHEASKAPFAPMATFIPEAYQRQAIEQA